MKEESQTTDSSPICHGYYLTVSSANVMFEILLPLHIKNECTMPWNLRYEVPHNTLKPLVLVFFPALDVEMQCYRNVCWALADKKPVADMIVYSLRKNIVTAYSHVRTEGIE
jgi:hypothetical protein